MFVLDYARAEVPAQSREDDFPWPLLFPRVRTHVHRLLCVSEMEHISSALPTAHVQKLTILNLVKLLLLLPWSSRDQHCMLDHARTCVFLLFSGGWGDDRRASGKEGRRVRKPLLFDFDDDIWITIIFRSSFLSYRALQFVKKVATRSSGSLEWTFARLVCLPW